MPQGSYIILLMLLAAVAAAQVPTRVNQGLYQSWSDKALPNYIASVSDGLVGYWPMNETNATLTLDRSGNAQHMTMAQATREDSIVNRGLRFRGTTNSYLIRSNWGFMPTNELSISVWFRTPQSAQGKGLVSWANTNNDNALLWYLLETNAMRLHLVTNTNRIDIPSTYSLNTWMHWVVTWSRPSGDINFYENGALVSATNLPITEPWTSTGTLVIAQDQDSVGGGYQTSQAYTGAVDEIAFWSRILSAEEVQRLYQPGVSP